MVRSSILLYDYYKAVKEATAAGEADNGTANQSGLCQKRAKGQICVVQQNVGRTKGHGNSSATGGLPRLASNRWQVLICGRTHPLVGTIPHEIACNISKHIPRVYEGAWFLESGPQKKAETWTHRA